MVFLFRRSRRKKKEKQKKIRFRNLNMILLDQIAWGIWLNVQIFNIRLSIKMFAMYLFVRHSEFIWVRAMLTYTINIHV